jgi:ANTAR domain
MTMADGTSRGTQVHAWVRERATGLGVSSSIAVLCETAVDRLGVTGVTLTVDTSAGWPETRHATDALGARLAELQVTVGEGPCLDVWREGGPVLVPDLDAPGTQQRWPMFAALAVESGASALFALPMSIGAIRLGVFALHRANAGPLEPGVLVDCLEFAELAMQFQLNAQAGFNGTNGHDLELRAPQVHQATGMVSVQLSVSMEEAFSRLRARAFADQRSLAELAADVVGRHLRFGPSDEA